MLALHCMHEWCVCLQLVYSSGQLIDALLGGAAQSYIEFKLLQQRCCICSPHTIDLECAWHAKIRDSTSAYTYAVWLTSDLLALTSPGLLAAMCGETGGSGRCLPQEQTFSRTVP